MRNIKIFGVVVILIIIVTVFTGCSHNENTSSYQIDKQNETPIYEMSIKISGSSGTTVLYANHTDIKIDSDTVKWNLYTSEGKQVLENEGNINYKQIYNAFYLTYKEFSLSFNTHVAAFYHLTSERPCTQLEVDGLVYTSWDN